jgi:hypothetical protein
MVRMGGWTRRVSGFQRDEWICICLCVFGVCVCVPGVNGVWGR